MKRIVLLALAVASPALAQSNGFEKTTSAGVYADTQTVLGETVFRGTCSACHVPSDFTGEQFKANWVGRTIWDYFVGLKKTMPEDNPGGLSNDEYARVTTYILKLNGYPAGTDSLAADSTVMTRIKISAPDAAKPPSRTRR